MQWVDYFFPQSCYSPFSVSCTSSDTLSSCIISTPTRPTLSQGQNLNGEQLQCSVDEWSSSMRQVQQVSHSSRRRTSPFSLSFCTLVYPPPLLLHSSSPLSNGNGTEPCWSSSARSELSRLRREFMDCHAVFLRFGPAGTENFSLWPKSFWPQSQQLTAIHHGSLAFVIMHNGTKSSSSALRAHQPSPK